MTERNIERQMYIYNARKHEKRTFDDIARELGISRTRVSQIYKRYDWEKNGYQADHHTKPSRKRKIRKYEFTTISPTGDK